MSAAATADAAPPAKGKKKLVMIIAAVVLLAVIGGGAMMMMKKKPAEDGEDGADAGAHAPAAAAKHDSHAAPPVFVPLEPFTVNLADRDSEHYAQVGITLEIDDAKTGEQIKTFMPAIRNNILMAIADRSASELMGREGKTKLADKIKRETAKALGYEIEDDADADGDAKKADGHGDDDEDKPKKKSKKKKAKKVEPALPVKAVHFSNFIIQ